MEIVVPDEKLSLAIGRKGQNVRLASQLTDWKLDVISDSKFKKMEEEAVEALQQIEVVSDALAKSMYRMGFRALEEVSEAAVEELASIQGIDNDEAARTIKETAATTMERVRDERVLALATRDEPPTERERMLCVPGIGARTLTLLEDGGYKSLASLVREDEDRLGIRTGLGLKKAAQVRRAASEFAQCERELFAVARASLASAQPPAEEEVDSETDDAPEASSKPAEQATADEPASSNEPGQSESGQSESGQVAEQQAPKDNESPEAGEVSV